MDIRGLIVLIIATGIMALLIVGIVGAAFWGKSLTGAAVESLSTVLGMLIGVVASYVAGQYANRPSSSAPAPPVGDPPKPVDQTLEALPPSRGDVVTPTTKESDHAN